MAGCRIEVEKTENAVLHWGLVSTYRREIMGAASLLVMCCHSTFRWPDSLLMQIVRTAFVSGNVGVELFLLVSGVGLCYAYEKRTSLGRFYLSRYVRLLIPYLLLCIPYWAWRDLWVGKDVFYMDVFQLTFLLKGISTYWYITASAVFYLVFPLIYRWIHGEYAIAKKITRQMRVTVIFLLCMITLFVTMYRHPTLYRNTEIAMTRILTFIIGCYLGGLVKEKCTISGHWLVISAAVCLGIPLMYKMMSMHDYWYRVLYVGFGVALLVVMIWLFQFSWMKGINRILRYCGERSMELYITHVSLRNVFETYDPQGWLDRDTVGGYVVVLVISVILSIIVHPIIKRISDCILKKNSV